MFKSLGGLTTKANTADALVASLLTSNRFEMMLYIVGTLKARVKLNNTVSTIALLDTRAEINVITAELAAAAGLALYYNPKL